MLLLSGVNSLIVNRETKPAEANGGTIVEVDGAGLHVIDEGPRQGPPVVLLHRAAGSVAWWEAVASRLRRDHRVIRIDFLGHGGSEKPRAGYELEHQARLVEGVLDRLGVRRALFAGHSLGALVAVEIAEERPDLVDRLALFGPTARPEDWRLTLAIRLPDVPLLGPLAWQIGPDALVRKGLRPAFREGFEIPISSSRTPGG